MRGRGFAHGTDRPIRRDPFAGGMCQKRREPDVSARLVDRRGLLRGDLVLTQALPDDVEATGQRCIAEGPVALARERRAYGRDQRLFGVAEIPLRLGQGRSDGTDRFTGSVHRPSPHPTGRN